MAWQIEQNQRCPRCGAFAWEADEYEADGFHCAGCEALDVEAERRRDQPETPGVRLVLYPKDVTDGS